MIDCFSYRKAKLASMNQIWVSLALVGLLVSTNLIWAVDGPYAPPASGRVTYSFNPDWRFIRDDVAGAEAVGFDDSKWEVVSTPHTFNDVDSFRTIISHSGGDRGTWTGVAWYRKHFTLPGELEGRKVFVEFEGMRQAGRFFVNGKEAGLYENGVTAYGIDISTLVNFGDKENVLAVKVDNRTTYKEESSGAGFEWNVKDFNPDFGGINRRVWLHVAGKIYQTLPVYDGLEGSGVYVHAANFDIGEKSADVTADCEVKNESGDRATVGLSVVVVDHDGQVAAKFDGDPVDMVNGEKSVMSATGPLKNARFWSVDDPYLYDVFTILTVDGKTVDVNKVASGFRKTEFKGGAGTGGVYVNDKFVYLKGFSQRSSDEWAGLGQAYPDWMHDLTAQMIRDCHGNYVRWMHVSPQRVDVERYDRYGIIEACPAGDKERDVQGRQWDQRVEVMRDSMIYFRNSPSILFWEAGNTIVTPEQMQQMVDLRKQYDPDGGRVMGTRDNDDAAANNALTPVAEYYGVMIGQDRRTDGMTRPGEIFRGYSVDRRDRAPLVETEDFREEGARRFWDDFSPPHFGFKKGPNDTYQFTSESFALAGVARYWAYWTNRISNSDPAHAKWSGYASIYFSDSDADGRQDSSEVCRVSGKMDAVRLPKEIYFAHRVMQSDRPDIHIIGHWTYPAGTKKTMYVICNCDAVELSVNGISKGKVSKPTDGFIFAFPDIAFEPGTIKAVGFSKGQVVCEHELKTAGPAKRLKLTAITGPGGLRADHEDVALVDFEVIDDQGERCPTDEGRVDFKVDGPGIWRGGYNSGIVNSTNNLYCNTECGINRVSLRSTLEPGKITVTATRKGLEPATVEIESKPVQITNGLEASEEGFPPMHADEHR
jgi:beta-galactosidase